jgi:hypothetical protein
LPKRESVGAATAGVAWQSCVTRDPGRSDTQISKAEHGVTSQAEEE